MKSIRQALSAFIILLAAVNISGCKKEDVHKPVDPKPVCRIISISIPSINTVYQFVYNGGGKISRVSSSTSLLTYEYTGDSIIVTSLDSLSGFSKTIIHQNASGLATNAKKFSNPEGTVWLNTTYEYNGIELAKATSTSSQHADTSVTTYAWQNGNMMSNTHNGVVTVYDYYPDKPAAKGDYFYFIQVFPGYETFRTKNALKSVSAIRFNYEFNLAGNIDAMDIVTDNGTIDVNYEYECND